MTQFFIIDARTHLHVGSGDSNYGVIDKLVQRDPTNQLPCIFASSLKGAFREYFKSKKGDELAKKIFGFDLDDKSKLVFHQAMIYAIPVRCNKYPYVMATSSMVLDEVIEQLELLKSSNYAACVKELEKLKDASNKDKIVLLNIEPTDMKLEDFSGDKLTKNDFVITSMLENMFGTRIAIFPDADFKDICSDYSLPVIARNNLENGQSKNLWYEQIVPRKSKYFFAVTPIDNANVDEFLNLFNETKEIQIGANATIGYGLCSISKI